MKLFFLPDILGKVPAQIDHGNRGLVVLQFVPLVPGFTKKSDNDSYFDKNVQCPPLNCEAVLLVGEWSNIPFNVVAPTGGLENILLKT